MQPILNPGDMVLVNKTAYWLNQPQRGDVVTFHRPDSDILLVKRIVAIPGDRLDYPGLPQQYVPEKSYVMMGDNRDNSFDSRLWKAPLWGFVPYDNIHGRVERVLFNVWKPVR